MTRDRVIVRLSGSGRPRLSPGFTLVELMVALVLAAVIAALAHMSVQATVSLGERAHSRLSVNRRSAAVRRQISDWLAAAYLPNDAELSAVFAAEDGSSGTANDDALTFFTLSPGPFRHGRATVSLFIDRDPATAERGLVAAVTLSGERHGTRVEVVPQATGLDVRYLFRTVGAGTWFQAWNSRVRLPLAAELTLSGDSLPRLLQMPITVPIRREP